MKKRPIYTLFLLGLLIAPQLNANNSFTDKHPDVADAITLLDVWINEQMNYQHIPGLSIAIVYDQELIWSAGYGYSNLEQRTPATPQSIYRIASITKLFTSTAIMQLRDADKLRLDDPVSQYLPWFEIQNPFPDAPKITIWHLLTHTSGLPREAAFPYWTDHQFPTREEMIAALPEQTAVYPPETRYKYSNLGMALLGEVVAAASGEAYADYVRKNIIEPLEMTSTTVEPTQVQKSRLVTAYQRRMPDGERLTFDYYETQGLAPAANIVSTVEDLARFASLQFREGPAGGDMILKGSTLREMHRPQWVYPSWSGGQGLGFGITRREDKTIVSHGGWVGGNRSHLLLVPDEKIAVIVMVNADDVNPYFFSYETYDVVGPPITKAVTPKTEKKKADPIWKKYVGDYVDPWGWEYKILVYQDQLAVYEYNYPPVDNVADALTILEPVDKHTFRLPYGEYLVFVMGSDGQVEHLRWRYDYIYPK